MAGVSTRLTLLDNMSRPALRMANSLGAITNRFTQVQNSAVGLTRKLAGAAAAYVSLRSASQAVKLSDEIAATTSRIGMLTNGLEETLDLQNQIFAAASRSGASYQDMVDSVAKLGLLAGDAFSSQAEMVAFAEQMNKQFAIGGQDLQTQQAAMRQLVQAMGSGRLQGDEFVSVMEGAPQVAEAIAAKFGKTKGELKELSSKGVITAEAIKSALFSAAEETDARFAQMPRTFGQVMTNLKNNGLRAFEPLLMKINGIANSEKFKRLEQRVIGGFSTMAGFASRAFDKIITGADWASAKIEAIAPYLAAAWSWLVPKTQAVFGVAQQAGQKLVEVFTTAREAAGKFAGIIEIAKGYLVGLAPMVKVAFGAGLSIIQDMITEAGNLAQFISDNWSTIEPIVWGIVAAVGAWKIVTLGAAAAQGIAAVAQAALNAVMAANPIMFVIMGIAALIAIIANWVKSVGGIQNAWEIFCKNAEIAWMGLKMVFTMGVFKILDLFDNLQYGISSAVVAIQNWMSDMKVNVLSTLQDMLNGAIAKINGFITAINSITGTNIGVVAELTFGAETAIEEEANRRAREAGLSKLGESRDARIQSRANEIAGMQTAIDRKIVGITDTAASGAEPNRYNKNAGATIYDSSMGAEPMRMSGTPQKNQGFDYSIYGDQTFGTAGGGGAGQSLSNIDKNTKAALEYSEEELRLWRDIAERDTVNRFTTAQIVINQNNENHLASDMDMDGVTDFLVRGARQALEVAAKGVYA